MLPISRVGLFCSEIKKAMTRGEEGTQNQKNEANSKAFCKRIKRKGDKTKNIIFHSGNIVNNQDMPGKEQNGSRTTGIQAS